MKKSEKERMENEESSRPSIGFPLGFALLLILLLSISGFLVGYVNWHKIRALFLQSPDHDRDENDETRSDIDHSQSPDVQPASLVKKERQKFVGQSLPVLMPGDRVPRFIAMACSCEPAIIEKIEITVQKPPPEPVPFHYS